MSDSSPEKKSKAKVFAARLFSTLLLWGIVTGVFMSGNVWAFIGLMTVCSFLGVKEYFQMTQAGGMPSLPKLGMLMSLVYLILIGWLLGTRGRDVLDYLQEVDAAFVVLIVMGGFTCQLRKPVEGKKTLKEIALTVLGFVYIPVMFSFAARLLFFPEGESAVPSAWLVLWLVAVTKFTDMGAYVTGSLIGKHKMIPHISPGKTWQGFVGGLVFAQLAGCGLFALIPEQLAVLGGWGTVIGLSFALAVLAVIGDLAESVVKRSIGVKDSGATLPGIGGALDLIDSICFTAPALYFFLYLTNI